MAYIQVLLTHFGMENSTPVAMPAAVKERLTTSDCLLSDADHSSYDRFAGDFGYLECLGGILYVRHTTLANHNRINACAQFGANPGRPHLTALKRILRYLRGMINHSLVLGESHRGCLPGIL